MRTTADVAVSGNDLVPTFKGKGGKVDLHGVVDAETLYLNRHGINIAGTAVWKDGTATLTSKVFKADDDEWYYQWSYQIQFSLTETGGVNIRVDVVKPQMKKGQGSALKADSLPRQEGHIKGIAVLQSVNSIELNLGNRLHDNIAIPEKEITPVNSSPKPAQIGRKRVLTSGDL